MAKEADPTVWNCPFDYAEALEFDPTLRRIMTEEPVARIRLPYGEGEAWLVTKYDDVRTVTTDRRFSRHAIVGRDFPRMTPEPIVQDEAINVMDPPASRWSACAPARSTSWTSCWTGWSRTGRRGT